MPPLIENPGSGDRVTAWQCIGCGRVEAPQPCIGVCQDRKVDFVVAAEYEKALARIERFEMLARQLAYSLPRDDQWERSYRAMQDLARRILAEPGQANDG